ncbi:hypothetical protein [Pseudogemmobacter sp. W21_MBD1_M6]|uniref:hypothetical protein n=1 Tax=Pseudogemmobacter sp. W21_MBD1_M6 TaxID=3240271 RepID=UPI003F9CF77B
MEPGAGTGDVTFDRLMLSIGRLNYAWTNTESMLIHVIAGLLRIDKEQATVIFLTLNTTRARVDLVERLAKLTGTPDAERDRILGATRKLLKLAGVRNWFSHCIYSFDAQGKGVRTIQMRIADQKNRIKIGQTRDIDADTPAEIDRVIGQLGHLNEDIRKIIHDYGYPA